MIKAIDFYSLFWTRLLPFPFIIPSLFLYLYLPAFFACKYYDNNDYHNNSYG